jgi:hypothetical protein
VKAVTGALEKSVTIKKPTSGAVVPMGGTLVVEITNPYKASVNLEFSPKEGGTWAGSGAFTQTTKGTSTVVSSTKFKSGGVWTVRAFVPNVMSLGGGPSVDFVVGSP